MGGLIFQLLTYKQTRHNQPQPHKPTTTITTLSKDHMRDTSVSDPLAEYLRQFYVFSHVSIEESVGLSSIDTFHTNHWLDDVDVCVVCAWRDRRGYGVLFL